MTELTPEQRRTRVEEAKVFFKPAIEAMSDPHPLAAAKRLSPLTEKDLEGEAFPQDFEDFES